MTDMLFEMLPHVGRHFGGPKPTGIGLMKYVAHSIGSLWSLLGERIHPLKVIYRLTSNEKADLPQKVTTWKRNHEKYRSRI